MQDASITGSTYPMKIVSVITQAAQVFMRKGSNRGKVQNLEFKQQIQKE